jgi:fimbrial chaperone protein
MRITPLLRPLRAVLLVAAAMSCLLVAPVSGGTGSALVIWPIDPVIEDQQIAAPLWLENRGTSPLALQIRVVSWRTENYDDVMVDEQSDVIASPPVAELGPGVRQLVRLVKTGPTSAGLEQAFRVIIDEIPQAGAERVNETQLVLGVALRLRYSLPLFVYGEGLMAGRQRPVAGPSRRLRAAAPNLHWRIVGDKSRRWLYVRNTGDGHARLTGVRVESDTAGVPLADGLLGYVLPGAERRWQLPESNSVATDVMVVADVNGGGAVRIRPSIAVQ